MGLVTLAAIGAGGALASGLGSAYGARQQRKASEAALAAQQKEAARLSGLAEAAGQNTRDALQSGFHDSIGYVQRGYDMGQKGVDVGLRNQAGLVGAGLQGAQERYDTLYGLGGGLTGEYMQGATSAVPTASTMFPENPRRLEDLMNSPKLNLAHGFETDPGYRFRQQQGEEAIARAAAAQGGRYGGATLKALSEYNQNLASDEFNRYTQRRAQEAGMLMGAAGQLDQQDYGARQFDAANQLRAQLAAQQNQANFANAGLGFQGDALNSQAQNEAMAGQLLGGIEAQRGMNYGQSIQGRNLAEAQMRNQLANQLANSYQGTVNQQIGVGSQLIPQMQIPTQYAGQGIANFGNAVGGAINNIGMAYALGGGLGGGSAPRPGLRVAMPGVG